jgi:hypothetical protein
MSPKIIATDENQMHPDEMAIIASLCIYLRSSDFYPWLN